jgi:hypothetical protein
MTYTLGVLSAAEAENSSTIEWLAVHASPDRAALYEAAISKALDEILELPFACAASPIRSSTEFESESCWLSHSPT